MESVADEVTEPDLTSAQRAATLEAIAYFRVRFGEGWIRQAFDRQHPFVELVWNHAPWTRVRLADLAGAIKLLESLAGGTRLVNRFARADQYSGAVFELDIAATAMGRDLSVLLEAPTQPGRNCDMAVSRISGRNSTTVYIEAQVVQDYGLDTHRAMEIAERLVPPTVWVTMHRELLGHIVRIPSDAQLPRLLPLTDAFWRRCESSTEPEHLVIDGFIDLWSVPIGHKARADLVTAGVPENFTTPVPDDPLRRTIRGVRQKIGQLPLLAPGLIAVKPPRLLFLNPRLLPQVVEAIKRSIVDAPQICAVALVDWSLGAFANPREARATVGGALIVRHPDRHIFVREAVIVANPVRAFNAGDDLIAELL